MWRWRPVPQIELRPRPSGASALVIKRLLRTARVSLAMDVSFVVAVERGAQVLTFVDGDAASFGWRLESVLTAGDHYCQDILAGKLPAAIPDCRRHPRTATMAATDAAGIGCFVGVPLVLADGRTYGMLGLSSHTARQHIPRLDVTFIGYVAQAVADELSRKA